MTSPLMRMARPGPAEGCCVRIGDLGMEGWMHTGEWMSPDELVILMRVPELAVLFETIRHFLRVSFFRLYEVVVGGIYILCLALYRARAPRL